MQKKRDWEFLFLGANMDAISAAADIGIRADRSVTYHSDAKGTAVKYEALSKAVSNYRMATVECCDAALDGWDEDIKKDYRKRSRK